MKSEINEKIYSKVFSESNERYHIEQMEKLERIVDLFEPCDRVLDVGCGDGWFGKRIIEDFGADVHGVDISKDALKKAELSGLKVKRQDLDGNKLSYPNNYFDAVLCGDILEHLINTEFFLKELRRVLKKTKETLTKLIVYHGFRIEDVKGSPMVAHNDHILDKYKKYVRISNSLEKFFARFPTLASVIIVKARKV
jgi:ubiquinone/menaquinone biosynthesis C-methylase UbiE